jgi:hypothetical protein
MAHVGNVLSIPRALRIFARATVSVVCDSADLIGNAVYISGDAVSNKYSVCTADPIDSAKMPAIGVLWTKKTSTTGTVRLFGELKNVYTGLTPGAPLYVGLDSRLTHTPPVNPGGPIYAQEIGYAISSAVPFLWGGPAGSGLIAEVFQRPLVGPRNGVNTTYTTPEKFLADTIRVYRNGVRQQQGAGLDFISAESGGPGTGYDTVIFGPGLPPVSIEMLFADYVPSV